MELNTGGHGVNDVANGGTINDATCAPALSGLGVLAQRPSLLALSPNVVAVDVLQAADMLGVSDDTIRREINRGRLRAARVGRLVRIRVAELTAYLKRSEGA
ncbi:MAG: helix-turn-helix domain-containing protein [Planctomycetota bacterium]